MKITDNGIFTTDWVDVESKSVDGEHGTSQSKTLEYSEIRIRIIEYSPGYKADHWCPKGHIIFVLEGELIIKLKDETEYRISKGMSFICGDSEINSHAAYSKNGASVLIID